MRQMWLEKKDTKLIWNCLPDNPYKTEGGCLFGNPQGLGYQQEITQNQIDVDYFISNIKSLNQEVIVEAYFNGNEHLSNFVDFIGDFSAPMYLYYSPDGSIQPYDQISNPYYKPVVISTFEKSEMNTAGWYVCQIKFTSQSDVWRKDYTYSVKLKESDFEASSYQEVSSLLIAENVGKVIHYIGEDSPSRNLKKDHYYRIITTGTNVIYTEDIGFNKLFYPYTYPYVFGGTNTLAISIDNKGRETGCIVKITNTGDTPISDIEWFAEHTVVDRYGNANTTPQRAKFFTTLRKGYTMYVDSNSTTQEAMVIYPNDTSQSVVNQQEPSWDYINFVRLKHGTNRFVFYVANRNVDIRIQYAELKEVV